MSGRSLLRIIDFFFPIEIISALLIVFALENVLDKLVSAYIPAQYTTIAWLVLGVIGILFVSMLNLLSADEDEIDELEEDVGEVINGDDRNT